MAGIGACKFYKKLVACVPSNNKDSEGSSDSGDCCDNVEKASKSKKKVRKGCLVAIEDDNSSDSSESSSDSSEPRWKRNNAQDSDLVVPPSEHSSENLTTVSSTCISPMSNISSLVGSVTTLPPSPRPLSNNEAPRRKPVSKKPVVIVQDRYTQKKPKERFETQHVNKNIVNVPCFPSKLPPVNPCRKMLFPGGSGLTITLQQSNKGTSSNRAKKLLEAASPRKPESSVRSAVNNPSPQKILAQRKRTLRPTQNEESAKAMKPTIAASTPGITLTHPSSSSRSSIFSRNNNQIVFAGKKNIDAVSKKNVTGAVSLLEASSPRKPLSSANSVVNLPSPQKVLTPRKRALLSTQNSSQNKENLKMMKASATSTVKISHTHSSSSSLSKNNNELEFSGDCEKNLDSVSNKRDTEHQSKGFDSKDNGPKDIPCSLPLKCNPTPNSFDGGLRQIAVVSSPISPSRGQIPSPGLSPITPGAATFPFLKKTKGTSTPPSGTGGLLRKGVQSSITQCNNTSAKESGQQEKDAQVNLQSISPRNCVSSPDMFEEHESPSVPDNIQQGKSAPQNARLGTLRGTTLSGTDQAIIQPAAAKTNCSGVDRTSKPSQASTSKNTNTRKNPQRAARVDRDYCLSPSASERNKAAPLNKKEIQKKNQNQNPNLDPIAKATNKNPSIQSKYTFPKESGQQENDAQDNLESSEPPNFLSFPDMFEEYESLSVPETIQRDKSAPQNARLGTLQGTTLSGTHQAIIQPAAAKTNCSGVDRTSKPSQASTSENTNTRKNPQRAARVDLDYCLSPSASETNEDDVVELEELEDHRQQNVVPKNKKKNPKEIPKQTQNGTKQKKTKTTQGKVQKKSKPNQENGQKKSKKVVVDQMWHEGDIPEIVFPEEPEFTQPVDVKSPLDYFRYYFDDELIDMIVHQTNLYTTQQSGKSICVTSDEILAFFGIMIYMGVCSLPAAEDYWAMDTRITQVCQVMSRNRFQQIHAKIHFHNNEEEGDDKLLKIRPLLDHMRRKCHGVEQEYKLSVDERMQGYKGTRAGSLRQYLPDKPSSRFGFKLFVLAGKSGMTYDFIPYTGQDTFDSENLTVEENALGVGAQAVISLCKSIKNPACTTVTIDNFYTGIPLLIYLRDKMNLNSVGTIKRCRTLKCPLTDGEEILAKGRGSLESFVNKDGIVVLQWADNKPVCLASSFVGLEPISTARRYSKEARAKIDVKCPRAVLKYNETMGGVDLADMFMGIYKIPTRARRYYFSFIGYSLELALTNSWLQYKRDCKLLKIPKKKEIASSKKFRLEVSEDLKTLLLQSHGEPSLDQSLARKKIKHPVVCRPNESLRTDGYKHLPKYCDKGRCRYCKKGTSRMKCTKCEVVLCFNKDRNCFTQFHITKKGQLAPEDRVEQDTEDEENLEDAEDEENLEEMDELEFGDMNEV